MMTGVDQDARLRAGFARKVGGHAPVRNIRVIESRFKWLVFDEQALACVKMSVRFTQGLFKPPDALANALRAGIVGAVGQPERKIATPKALGDLDGIENVVCGLFADLRRRIA